MDCRGRNSFCLRESKSLKYDIISISLFQLLVSSRFEMLNFMCDKACFNENDFSCFSIYVVVYKSLHNYPKEILETLANFSL